MRLLFLLAICAPLLPAQTEYRDSLRMYLLNPVIVTGDRSSRPLLQSMSSVAVVDSALLVSFPVPTISRALNLIPGIVCIDRDGLGNDPVPIVRGYYGGGESEYLQVLHDGTPAHKSESGLAQWETATLFQDASFEAVRGGSSALYGDGSMGGVLNLLRGRAHYPGLSFRTQVGTFGLFRLDGYASARMFGLPFKISAGRNQGDGYRDHAHRVATTAGLACEIIDNETTSISIRSEHAWLDQELPGALADVMVHRNPQSISPFHSFDSMKTTDHVLSVSGAWKPSAQMSLKGVFKGSVGTSRSVRTLLLDVDHGETQLRDLRAGTMYANLVADGKYLPVSFEHSCTIGVDVSYQRFSSTYSSVFAGTAMEYMNARPEAGTPLDAGTHDRLMTGIFSVFEIPLPAAVKLSLGGRFDAIRSIFASEFPSPLTTSTTLHTVWSPKAALHYSYTLNAQHHGRVFATLSQSFKAPSADQLFDQRSFNVAFPPDFRPVRIYLANNMLQPQYATGFEIGIHHVGRIHQGDLAGELSAVFYSTNVRNEIDFDLARLSYMNIARSRHIGIETGVKVYGPASSTVFVNWTFQAAASQSGDNAGKYLKGIPLHAVTAGIAMSPVAGIRLGILARSIMRTALDDANTMRIPDYTVADAVVSWRLGIMELRVEILNILNRSYASTGYPDPAGSGIVYWFPAAKRSFALGIGCVL